MLRQALYKWTSTIGLIPEIEYMPLATEFLVTFDILREYMAHQDQGKHRGVYT